MQIKMGYVAGKKKPVNIDLDVMQNLMNGLLEEFEFEILPEAKPYRLLRKSTQQAVDTSGALSSGEAELFSLAVDLLTMCALWELDETQERILLVDEPDTHLHPDLQQHLARFLLKLIDQYKTQMIVSTHSTTLLAALGHYGLDRTSVVYLDNSAVQQSAMQFNVHLQEMATLLGGHALMGPLFGTPLLLVEGDDEYRVWSHVPRLHKVQLVALPCGGASEVKKYHKTLETIFGSLLSNGVGPVGYALLDGDQVLPNGTQQFIAFIKLACRETENLYLTDEVLADMGISWEAAKAKIIERAPAYGQKRGALESCLSWDRQASDIKNVIEQVAEIVDPKRVHWTLRVAKTIGKNRPQGQLAEFLGDGVLNAFWPTTQNEVTN